MKEMSSGDMPWPIANDERPDLPSQPPFPAPPVWASSYPGGVAGRKRGQMNERDLSWESAQPATSPQIKPRASMVSSHFDEKGLPPWLQDKNADSKDEDSDSKSKSSGGKGSPFGGKSGSSSKSGAKGSSSSKTSAKSGSASGSKKSGAKKGKEDDEASAKAKSK
jgi:hypothetical protein